MTEEAPTTGDAATKEATVFHVRDFIDATQMKKDMSFSDNDLTGAMMQQASLFAHYGELSAKAAHQVDVVKMLLESTEAAVYKVERDRLAASGEKFTEALLEKIVARHSRVIQMKKALNEARRVEAMGKVAVEGFRHRKDMLVQQGAQQREELKGEIYTASVSARDAAQQNTRQQVLDRLADK